MEYQFESLGPTLRVVALGFLLVFVLLILALTVGLAALPGKIAARRGASSIRSDQCLWLARTANRNPLGGCSGVGILPSQCGATYSLTAN